LPEIGRIQSTNFQSLLTDLGITRNNIPFALRSEVTPVVLVGGTVSFIAAPTPAYGVTDIFTAGIVVAPAVNTILADTGPLPVGAYSVQWILTVREQNILAFEWRNAANSADLWLQRLETPPTGEVMPQFSSRFNVLNDNERFRIRVASAGTAAIEYQATILARI